MGARMRQRAAGVLVALACAGGLLSACSDDDDSSASPGPEASTPSVPASSSPASSSPASPSAPTTSAPPGPAAATGRRLVEDRVSVRAPQGWKVTRSTVNPYVTRARDPETLSSFILSDFPAQGERTVDGEAADALDFHGPDVKRVADVTLGGQRAYRVQGQAGTMRLIEIGTLHGGGDVMVQFQLSPLQEAADQRKVVESVLASLEWRT